MIIPGILSLALMAADSRPAAELALLDGDKLARIELRVEVNGTPVAAIWDETFARLLAFFDRNGDGTLDAPEAARLPSPLALRQAMGNGFTPPVGPTPAFVDIARGDGKLTAEELASFYRDAGAGTVLIGVGRLPASARLTIALIESLDSDDNGKVDEDEWKKAPQVLKGLDGNDDELIGAGELVPKLLYPGAAGTTLMAPATDAPPSGVLETLPLLLLPADHGETRWAVEVARRQPRFKAEELTQWRKQAPDAAWVVRLDDEPDAERFAFEGQRIRLSSWATSGKMEDSATSARLAMTSRLENPPAPENGGNRRHGGDLSWLTPIADRNADDQLDREELDAWLDLQSQIARGQVLVTVLDDAGLFEILDTSHDGALSVRELRTAWERLNNAGCVTAGAFDRARLPRVVLAAVSRGYPKALALGERRGPSWFRAMDRNGDGDVSRREFTGPASAFTKLDRDGDALIDADEAARPVASPRESDRIQGQL